MRATAEPIAPAPSTAIRMGRSIGYGCRPTRGPTHTPGGRFAVRGGLDRDARVAGDMRSAVADVGTELTQQLIVILRPVQRVVAVQADQDVRARIPGECIAEERARRILDAQDRVRPLSRRRIGRQVHRHRGDRVEERHQVPSRFAIDDVVPLEVPEEVVAGTAGERVVRRGALQSLDAGQRVVALAGSHAGGEIAITPAEEKKNEATSRRPPPPSSRSFPCRPRRMSCSLPPIRMSFPRPP